MRFIMLARIGRQGDERMGFMRGPVPGNSLSGCLRLGRHRLDPTEFGRSSAARSQGPAPSSRPLARRCFEPQDESAAIAAAACWRSPRALAAARRRPLAARRRRPPARRSARATPIPRLVSVTPAVRRPARPPLAAPKQGRRRARASGAVGAVIL